MKKILLLLLSTALITIAVPAQTIEELMEQVPIPENVDAMTVTFHFDKGSSILNLDNARNKQALDTLCMVINIHILDKGGLLVNGYGSSDDMVLKRCNNIKSKLASLLGVKESQFTTKRHNGMLAGQNDVVTVTVPSNVMASALRDFEIMRILSTPQIITVVKEIPVEEPIEIQDEELISEQEQKEVQPAAALDYEQPQLNKVKSLYPTKSRKAKTSDKAATRNNRNKSIKYEADMLHDDISEPSSTQQTQNISISRTSEKNNGKEQQAEQNTAKEKEESQQSTVTGQKLNYAKSLYPTKRNKNK